VQQTLFMLKPDAVQRNLIGRMLARVEEAGFTVRTVALQRMSRADAEEFYAVHGERPFFPALVEYMTSGPIVVTVLEREDAVAKLREVIGATDPAEAAPGTVRRDYGLTKQANSCHASDSPENARNEIAFWARRGLMMTPDAKAPVTM
jgi:nucleoside-diphosphate kinase